MDGLLETAFKRGLAGSPASHWRLRGLKGDGEATIGRWSGVGARVCDRTSLAFNELQGLACTANVRVRRPNGARTVMD